MTQTTTLLEYLKEHRKITPLAALSSLGIYRLSARIKDLRKKHGEASIKTIMRTITTRHGKARIAEYRITDELHQELNRVKTEFPKHICNK